MSEQRIVTNLNSQEDGLAGPPSIPPYEPITLTWEPNSLYPSDRVPANQEVDNNAPQRNEGRPAGDRSPGARLSVPMGAPPSYDVARIPNRPVTYTFSSLGPASGAVILVPPADLPDTRPLYHISISHDPFLPHCLITSVMRGGTTNGTYVGGFTTITGIDDMKNQAETVCIRAAVHSFYTVFRETTIKNKGMACHTFSWLPSNTFTTKHTLKWTTSKTWPQTSLSTCTLASDSGQTKIAEFTPCDQLKEPFSENALMVMPAGHSHLDDILISALLLERRRRMEMATNSPWSVRP
ncbi:hypothetical protein BDN70DRAFT_874791 [Pholiota conissans]|uniref:DUF6593 domain-containing protein n=1 Tax=Pholiota conissans TaxID=109636 RepID=A0A9P5Z7M5_9AGAR|nr:hypothetical protein BDN70DRAFT_874791 [Pholiota conissans]